MSDLDTSTSPVVDQPVNTEATPSAVEPQSAEQRDPREAEIERLRAENARLAARASRKSHEIGRLHERLSAVRNTSQPQTQQLPADGDDDETTQQPQRRAPSEEDVSERIRAEAAELNRVQRIAERARSAGEAGKKLDPKFGDLVNDMAEEIPLVDERRRPTEFAEAVLDCEKPAEVMLAIARDPELIDKLRDLRGIALGRQLARIEASLGNAKPNPSGAARPLNPLAAGATTDNSPRDTDSPEEWRRKEIARLNALRARTQPTASASR